VRTREEHLANGVLADEGVWAEVLALAGRSA
jgi:3-dehydro-L-gulonate 2-dehydrogenase